MDNVRVKLTVFFEEPFWIGVFERVSDGQLAACRVTFGSEPKDYEVLNFVLCHYHELNFSPALEVEQKHVAENPKRRQRAARRQIQASGIGTKSQQALKMQQDEMKNQRKQISREEREAEKKRRFDLKTKKRKAKHRGR